MKVLKTSVMFPQNMSCHRILNRQKNLTTKSTASFWTSERSCTPTDRTTFRQSLNLHRRLRAEGDGKEISSYSLFILLTACLFCKPNTAAHSPHLPVLYMQVLKNGLKVLFCFVFFSFLYRLKQAVLLFTLT